MRPDCAEQVLALFQDWEWMKGKFRRFGKLCWLHRSGHNITGNCTLFEIYTATVSFRLESALSGVYCCALEPLAAFENSLPYNSEMIRANLLIISIIRCSAEHYYIIAFSKSLCR